jgi:hypothetical protein
MKMMLSCIVMGDDRIENENEWGLRNDSDIRLDSELELDSAPSLLFSA